MSEAKYTRGPWVQNEWPDDEWSVPCRVDDMGSICQMIADPQGNAVAIAVTSYPRWINRKKEDEIDANSRLIAATPELLEALQGVLRVADRATIEFDAARAAIAKALGAENAN